MYSLVNITLQQYVYFYYPFRDFQERSSITDHLLSPSTYIIIRNRLTTVLIYTHHHHHQYAQLLLRNHGGLQSVDELWKKQVKKLWKRKDGDPPSILEQSAIIFIVASSINLFMSDQIQRLVHPITLHARSNPKCSKW